MKAHRRSESVTWLAPALASAFLVVVLLAGAAHGQTIVGTITGLTGNPTVARDGSTLPASLGMAIQLHDKLTTGGDSTVTVTLADGGTLTLRESSSFGFEETSQVGGKELPSRVFLYYGRIRSNVPDTVSGSARTFEIDTNNARGVMGGAGP